MRLAFIITGVINIGIDIGILCLPVPHVWNLQASLVRRVSLIGVFALGAFVVFASGYRFHFLFEFDPTDTPCTSWRPSPTSPPGAR